MPTLKIAIIVADKSCLPQAEQLSQNLQLPIIHIDQHDFTYLLNVTPSGLQLNSTSSNMRPLTIDFTNNAMAYRQKYGGGRQQLIARAVGLKAHYFPKVIDATAGLGEDGFILSTLGCELTLLERSPIIVALLADALQRASEQINKQNLKIKLVKADAITYLQNLEKSNYPQVIYLDPMFPARTKSALVKKEMRMLRDLVGEDLDATLLLEMAVKCATKRVVVKRPRLASSIPGRKPDIQYKGKSCRFDVYLLQAGN